jgi:DNA-binding Xre family transcriptional regulator
MNGGLLFVVNDNPRHPFAKPETMNSCLKTDEGRRDLRSASRKRRTARGLTQGNVAEHCATSIAFISDVERGLMPGLAVLLRLAAALECNVSELVRILDRKDCVRRPQ